MTNMEAFLIQEESYLDASRAEMIAEYGSVEAYIQDGLVFGGPDLGQLQDELLKQLL